MSQDCAISVFVLASFIYRQPGSNMETNHMQLNNEHSQCVALTVSHAIE